MEAQRLETEMLNSIIEALVDFTNGLLPRQKRLELDKAEEFPEELIRRMLSPELALQLVFIPEEYDGLGGGAYDIYRVSEELAKVDLGLATSFLSVSLGSDPIRVGGTAEQKASWMPRIANEGLIMAYGVTEPMAGSDLASFKTKADPVFDESGVITGYRLNGVKQFITNGGVADLYTILAMTPGGPSFFVLERGMEGLSGGKHEHKHGIRLSFTSQVILENVLVPADHLVGLQEGQGMSQAVAVFGYTRLMVAAFGLGGGIAAMKAAVRYGGERKQFDKLLLEMQGYTHRLLVPHVVRLEAARSYIEAISNRLDSGESGLETEGAIAKYFATEAGNDAAEAAIQALGGYGYMHDYEVEKIKRDVRITTIYEGTSEIMLQTIGKDRWRQFLQTRGRVFLDGAHRMDQLALKNPKIGAQSVARAYAGLDTFCEQVRLKRLTRQQFVLFQFAEMITNVETAESFCERASNAANESFGEHSEYLMAAARIHASNALSVQNQKIALCLIGFGAEKASDCSDMIKDFQILNLDTNYLGYGHDMDSIAEYLPTLAEKW